MATTSFFEATLKDQGGKDELFMEFGRSSFYPEESIYIKVGDNEIIVDRQTATEIVNAMNNVARYLNLDID